MSAHRTLRSLAPVLAIGALAAFVLKGPPGIRVTEAGANPVTPGAVLEIVATHHTEEEFADVSGRAISEQGGKRVTKDLSITRSSVKGKYGVTKQWTDGTAWVLVFSVKQGENGAHGTAEALVKVSAAGKVVGIENTLGKNLRGDKYPRAASEGEIEAALRAIKGR